MRGLSPAARQAWSVASRALAAIVGGYGFIWLLTAAMSLLLPAVFGVSPFEAVLATTMASFLVWALIVMATFHARSVRHVWIALLAGSVMCMIVIFTIAGRPLP